MTSAPGIIASAFAISLALTAVMLFHARRRGLVDVPNHRSSHSRPTPRGGGIGLVAGVMALSALAVARRNTASPAVWGLVATAVLLLVAVGWLDDRQSMPVSLRFPVHVAAGATAALLVSVVTAGRFAAVTYLLWLAAWLFWATASINIVNFMDGIDGMVAVQGVVYGIFLFLLLPAALPGAAFGLALGGACLGFLVLNWAPARIFMGDVGSGPLGLFFAVGGALALQDAHAALVFLPLFPLYLDSLLTLVLRHRRGEKLTEAHRSHLYQRVANDGVGHAPVTTGYGLAAAAGAAVALATRSAPAGVMAAAIAAYCAVVLLVWVLLDRRFPGPGAPA